MILFKLTVRINKLTPAIMHIFNTLYKLNNEQIPSYPLDWVITSINDSTHLPTSRHYTDEAIDLKSKNFTTLMIKQEFRDRLASILDDTKFTVIFEDVGMDNEHFHIQVKKGKVYV